MTERDIFLALLDLPDTVARSDFLSKACAGDATLRGRVESLLRSHDNAGSFLGKPALPPVQPGAGETQEVGAQSVSDDRAAVAGNDLSFLAPSTRPDSLGRLGHYEVLEVLGRGGFGIVFRAFDETLQRVVAVKVLAPAMAATSPARKRFLREARSYARVRHENVVQVYAVEEQPLPYLVMEFIPGETLQQRLNRTGPLETAEVVRIGRQIAEGLAAAHGTGLIHRDIKPANILIEAGPHQHVKITDFGLARAADDASVSQSGFVAGTPMFMAPEQAGGETLDHRTDLFSLGSVLYAMCTGRPPFRAPSTLAVLKRVAEDTPRPIREIIPEVPPWLCDLISRLHAKKPEDRIASAQEVADLLTQHLAELQHPGSVQAPQVAAAEKMPPTQEIRAAAPALKPRFRTGRWAAAAAVLMLLGGLAFTEATGVTDTRATVIRLFSPEGTLVVEVDDPEVSVKIEESDIVITGAGAKEIRLKPGRYTVEASKDGKLVSRELVTVTKNGRQVVRVSQEPVTVRKAAAEKQDPDRRAAQYVLSIGGSVRINGEDRDVRAVAELPQEPFRLTFVNLYFNEKVTDAGLAAFEDCPNVTELLLYACTQVTDAGLAHFKDCKGLTVVQLEGVRVTDAGLATFKNYKNLTILNLNNTQVTDDGLPYLKDCKNLTALQLMHRPVTDVGLAHLKDCKRLTHLDLRSTRVTDAGLAYFKDCKDLTGLHLAETSTTDAGLVLFKDCKNLTAVDLARTSITDAGLAIFQDSMNLTNLQLDGTKVSDAGLAHVEHCKNLEILAVRNTKVSPSKIETLRKALPQCKILWDGGVIEPRAGFAPFPDADVKRIAALPAAEQVEEVRKELKRRNPDFDGALTPTIENDVVTGLAFSTEQVSDVSPVRALTNLKNLRCARGKLIDLAPLTGLKLATLDLEGTQVSNLAPLQGMPLTSLNLHTCPQIRDLTPLKGMPLTYLNLQDGPKVVDFSPLKSMPLSQLWAGGNLVRDLSPLGGMPLTSLGLSHCPEVQDLAPLKGLSLTRLLVDDTQVRDLEPLKDMPLKRLYVFGPGITDLRPLQAVQLEDIRLTPKNIAQGLDILRNMKSLKTIGLGHLQAWPAAEFWARYDKGKFKQ
jgi:Leucine-rich repeat (LRR) protein